MLTEKRKKDRQKERRRSIILSTKCFHIFLPKILYRSLYEKWLRSLLYPTMFLGVDALSTAMAALARSSTASCRLPGVLTPPPFPHIAVGLKMYGQEGAKLRRMMMMEQRETGGWKATFYVSWKASITGIQLFQA